MRARWLGIAGEVLFWWGASVGIWVLTLSSVSVPELAVAAACGLVCGLLGTAGRRTMGSAWRPRAGWLRWLLPLAVAVPADAARLLLLTVRPRPTDRAGRYRQAPLDRSGPPAVRAAHEALAVLAVSATPGSFVVDVAPADGRLLIHSVSGGRPQMQEVVRR
jgi:multisubunit Na+/H+ antiporter MnhE subunit